MRVKLKRFLFTIWYWYISKVDKNIEVTFMNYGYSKDNNKIPLEEQDEKNRYSVQLYHYVATGVSIKGKDILEIGCGRGGGLSYVNRTLSPHAATGVDLNEKAIAFCKSHYTGEGIRFLQGNAQNLSFEDNTFDIVINVESSHRYSKVDRFVSEVYRVLKPGGYFLFADFRTQDELAQLKAQMDASGFETVKFELITSNVLEALTISSSDTVKLIQRMSPKWVHGLGKKFAATEGTPTYNKFTIREFEYFYYILRK